MAHITIKDIGPIKNVSFDLNKINVFMGPQSSGKSTIAKILSYCSWYEKNAILHPSNRPNFFKELIDFHNLEDSYFSENSEISYESDSCSFNFKWKDREEDQNQVDFQLKESIVYKNKKICYIPAERNFVTLQGLGKYNETRDNIMSFMYDWFLAKRILTEKNSYRMPFPGLGEVAFYYDKESDSDKVEISNDKTIKLSHASSGLRSCIPMLVVFCYVIMTIYNLRRAKTPLEIIDLEEKLEKIDNTEPINTKEQIAKILGYDSDYHYSQVIIEEPELNLFPKAQQELIYYMLSLMNMTHMDHQLIITTHSPFILFALNNCLMGGLVEKTIPQEVAETLPSLYAWMKPSDVSIYEIHDGTIKCIQDEDGIIEDNYLNQAYKENAVEYLSMLNYYEDEE